MINVYKSVQSAVKKNPTPLTPAVPETVTAAALGPE